MVVFLLTFTITALIVLSYVTGVFVLAQLLRDNSIMDIAYGPAFAVAAWGTYLLTDASGLTPLLLCGFVTVWAARLSLRILRKNWRKPEDPRYAAWRTAWSARGPLYFILRSYLQINLLQGIIIVIVALPVVVAITSPAAVVLPFLVGGLIVSTIGLLIEIIADAQLDRFLARKKAGTEVRPLMTDGLFRYSRRPNYFGESLIWCGLAIAVLPLPFGYVAVASPLLITFIVTRVTGPMLEELFLTKYPHEYRAYMATTSYFIPWFPKKTSV